MSRSSPPSSRCAGSSRIGRQGPTSCGESIPSETRNRGVRRSPWASAASASASTSTSSVHGAERLSSSRLRHQSRSVTPLMTITPASHSATRPSCQENPGGTAGAAVFAPAMASPPAAASGMVSITGTAGACASHGSSSGGATSPSRACRATSHHNQHWVAGGTRGNSRQRPQTRVTSTTVCTLVAASRSRHATMKASIDQSSCRLDCSRATSASSSASSSSLTSPRLDIQATKGLTEPRSVFSTKAATAPCTTSSSPVVAE